MKEETTKLEALFNQLGQSDADFMIGRSNHEVQTDSKTNTADGRTSLINTINPTQVFGSQVDLQTREKNIVN